MTGLRRGPKTRTQVFWLLVQGSFCDDQGLFNFMKTVGHFFQVLHAIPAYNLCKRGCGCGSCPIPAHPCSAMPPSHTHIRAFGRWLHTAI